MKRKCSIGKTLFFRFSGKRRRTRINKSNNDSSLQKSSTVNWRSLLFRIHLSIFLYPGWTKIIFSHRENKNKEKFHFTKFDFDRFHRRTNLRQRFVCIVEKSSISIYPKSLLQLRESNRSEWISFGEFSHWEGLQSGRWSSANDFQSIFDRIPFVLLFQVESMFGNRVQLEKFTVLCRR